MCAQRRLRSAWASAQSDRVFAGRMKKAWVLSYPLSAQRRLWSDWADAQADLSIRWAHMPFCWFCHEAAQIVINVDVFSNFSPPPFLLDHWFIMIALKCMGTAEEAQNLRCPFSFKLNAKSRWSGPRVNMKIPCQRMRCAFFSFFFYHELFFQFQLVFVIRSRATGNDFSQTRDYPWNKGKTLPDLIINVVQVMWAASWQNQQNDVCVKRRLRSAWESAQSDQSLRCALNG